MPRNVLTLLSFRVGLGGRGIGIEGVRSAAENLAPLEVNVSAKIWNTPELHTAQSLDYLSQFPWIVTEANTRYTVNHAVSAMLPIP